MAHHLRRGKAEAFAKLEKTLSFPYYFCVLISYLTSHSLVSSSINGLAFLTYIRSSPQGLHTCFSHSLQCFPQVRPVCSPSSGLCNLYSQVRLFVITMFKNVPPPFLHSLQMSYIFYLHIYFPWPRNISLMIAGFWFWGFGFFFLFCTLRNPQCPEQCLMH